MPRSAVIAPCELELVCIMHVCTRLSRGACFLCDDYSKSDRGSCSAWYSAYGTGCWCLSGGVHGDLLDSAWSRVRHLTTGIPRSPCRCFGGGEPHSMPRSAGTALFEHEWAVRPRLFRSINCSCNDRCRSDFGSCSASYCASRTRVRPLGVG